MCIAWQMLILRFIYITAIPPFAKQYAMISSNYRTVTMTMDADQDLLHTSIYVLQDTVPEDTETFYVTLRNPTGGAEIGLNNRIAINILSNDNAHGVIEIAQVRFRYGICPP